MKALLISGSARENSHTRALLENVGAKLKDKEVEVEVWDLAENQLPSFEVPFHQDHSLVPEGSGRDFIEAVNNADMVVIGTALYHGSYSGILKNALDYLLKDQLFEKPVGLVANGGGNTKNAQALNHLVTIVQTLYGVPMQTQIGTHGDDYSDFEGKFVISNPGIADRCERLATELVRFSKALA